MAVQNSNRGTNEDGKSGNDSNAQNSYWCKPVDEVFARLWLKTAAIDKLKAGCAGKISEDVSVAIQELDTEGLLLAVNPRDCGASEPSSGKLRCPSPTGNTKPADALTKLAMVENILRFDAELGASPTMYRAEAEDSDLGEEHVVVTVTNADDSSNKSDPSDSIIGEIRSELRICDEKGLFFEGTSSLKTFNQYENGFFLPASDGALETHLEIRDFLRFNTAEIDRISLVRPFHIHF